MTTADALSAQAAQATSAILLDTQSVLLRPDQPFVLTSGRKSPVYIDCRRLISFPRERAVLIGLAARLLAARGAGYDVVAGGETAGIPFAAFLADHTEKPMVYVRKQPKGFGRNAQIEGVIEAGARVLLVEDLATDGGSKLNFIAALRSAEATVSDCLVIFHYGIFPESTEILAREDVRLHGLATWHDVIAEADGRGSFTPADLASIREFLADPVGWSKARGGM